IVRNGISVTLADKIRAVDRIAQGHGVEELAELPEIGRMFSREPIGWNSRSVESVQDLDRQYKALRSRMKALEEDSSIDAEALAAVQADLDLYEPFHTAMLDIQDLYRDAKEAESEAERRELERQMVERAQQAMKEHF